MEEVRLFRLPNVREVVGLSRSEIYRLIALKQFPSPIPLSGRTVAWPSDVIQDWVRQRIETRQAAGTKPRHSSKAPPAMRRTPKGSADARKAA